jgi:hypothetical protein
MQTAANNQAARQQTADTNYNNAADPLINAYNTWLTNRTTQADNDVQTLQNSLNSEIAGEQNTYSTAVAGFYTTEQSGIQAAQSTYNNAVAGFSATQASSDQAARNTYSSAVASAQQGLTAAQAAYNNTVNQLYQQAMQTGQPPNQSALQGAYATLESANHAYSNQTAQAAQGLQTSLGIDLNAYATSEGPAYVTLQDGIATATANYQEQVATVERTKDDNEAGDYANADGQLASIGATYENDVETQYEALQLQLAPLVKTREDAYAAAYSQYHYDSLAAWAALTGATADATQTKTKADTDAYAAYDLGLDGPKQTLDEQLAQAQANLADALAKANTTYNTSVMAADVQDAEAQVEAAVGYHTGLEAQMVGYINTVAPAWAAAIISASGNDPATTTWANAWASYMQSVVSDTEGELGQSDVIYQNTEDAMLNLGPGLASQVSAADKLLADQAGQAEVTQVTNDTTAIVAYDSKVIPAADTATKGQIDDARAEETAEINADVQDGQSHADNATVEAKADSSAQVAFLQQADPEIASDDEAERTKSASDTNQAAQDEATVTKQVDAATQQEADDLAGDGQTLVDGEAKANKNYVIAEVGQAVSNANTQAANTAATIAAEPDTSFPEGETIGAPGIYIDISGIHASVLLPLFDYTGKLTGYKFFSLWDASWSPSDPGGHQFDITNYLGFKRGYFQVKLLSPTFDPEDKFDYFVPTTQNGVTSMLNYASQSAAGVGMWYEWAWDNYNVLNGQTCVGLVIDTMDQANLWPKGRPMWWESGLNLGGAMQVAIPGVIKLPNADTSEYAVDPPL